MSPLVNELYLPTQHTEIISSLEVLHLGHETTRQADIIRVHTRDKRRSRERNSPIQRFYKADVALMYHPHTRVALLIFLKEAWALIGRSVVNGNTFKLAKILT